MPGNDLTAVRALIPTASTDRNTAELNVSSILTSVLNDIEPKVTPAGLDMSADLSFLSGGTKYNLLDVGLLNLEDRAADPSTNESLYVKGDELYFRDGNGNNVALTSGGVALGGAGSNGITGDGYGTPVEILWNAGDNSYRVRKDATVHPGGMADIFVDDCHLSDGTYTAALNAASLATDVTYTVPTGVPGSTSLMSMTNTGQMGHTRDPSVDTLTLSGELKHATRTLRYGVQALATGTPGTYGIPTGSYGVASAGVSHDIPVSLDSGERITSLTITVNAGDTSVKSFKLMRKVGTSASPTSVASTTSTTSGVHSISLSSVNHVLASGDVYFIRYTSGHADDLIHGGSILYDRV